MDARALMVQGTGSGVGKSVIVAALCRIFLQDGYSVAPFKAQNMALNSYVTLDGKEMGRAQVVQAQASCVEPTCDMNPVLIKPTSDVGAQVIVRGEPVGNMTAIQYIRYKKKIVNIVKESFDRLASEYDVVVMEGAGSPAEVNLARHDFVNMRMAKYANAPVILVGDIDNGGVFAWLYGTISLLSKKERDMVKGFVINKFRGDKRLLEPGLRFIEVETGKEVLGVVPYFKDIHIPEEDSIPEWKRSNGFETRSDAINIAIVGLPHISNFTDFDALEREEDVKLNYVRGLNGGGVDVIILPGTKNTFSDMRFLRRSGIAKRICEFSSRGTMIVGICGGFQMLGRMITDRHGLESKVGKIQGLGMLDVDTSFYPEKVLRRVKARLLDSDVCVAGYEIHHGKTEYLKGARPLFEMGGKLSDGARSVDGNVWGTYIHGIFDNSHFREEILNRVRRMKGLPVVKAEKRGFSQDEEFDKLAQILRKNVDVNDIYRILKLR